jgi:hypothetical protein
MRSVSVTKGASSHRHRMVNAGRLERSRWRGDAARGARTNKFHLTGVGLYDGNFMSENSLFRDVKVFHRLTLFKTASGVLFLVLSPWPDRVRRKRRRLPSSLVIESALKIFAPTPFSAAPALPMNASDL